MVNPFQTPTDMRKAMIALGYATVGWASFFGLPGLQTRTDWNSTLCLFLWIALTAGPALLAILKGLRAWREDALDVARYPRVRMVAVTAISLGIGLVGYLLWIMSWSHLIP